MPVTVPQSEIDRAARLYKAGWSLSYIAKEMYMSTGSVKYRLLKADVTMRPRGGVRDSSVPKRLPPTEIDKTVKLYTEQCLSTTEIGQLLGISHTTVIWRLRKAGVKTRPRNVSAAIRFRKRGRQGGLPPRDDNGNFTVA